MDLRTSYAAQAYGVGRPAVQPKPEGGSGVIADFAAD